ncbi:DUF2269 domain-containing protein [Lentzea flaviverrucosa]|uniref:DUF2269 domain-containing protein n=1 Tax=Lentzea flaviverrucosa TaxID=200379 RepID=A0A1H9EZW5_9PSEU|nr:DUF2269 domain-containing protein [Lentzea flaviverrucosa]RDI35346.1 hypothetical protein DFR72_1011097 [Lentzea flaviverrucosa]SEQ31270.1 hypothetical protein SAMN05216195_102120 [Lentzea flaviverrucosa]
MKPRLRKLALTAHIASSVGWFGAVLTFLAVAVVGVTTQDDRVVRAANLIAEPMVWYVVLPFAVASLLSGLVSSLGSAWGLFRHYWVIFKLVLNVFATAVLLIYTRTVDRFAAVAADPTADLEPLRSPTFVVHAAGALVVLIVALALAVYKPRGVTGLRI